MSNAQLEPDGTLWYVRGEGDAIAIERVAWGSTTPDRPFGEATHAPAISPDGRTIAFLREPPGVPPRGPDQWVLFDRATSTERLLESTAFVTREPNGLEWSMDGEHLLFSACHEGCAALLLRRTASSVDESTPVLDESFADEYQFEFVSWVGPDRVLVEASCCYIPADASRPVVHAVGPVGGPFEQVDLGDEPVALEDAAPDGRIAILRDSGVVEIRDPSGAFRVIETGEGMVEQIELV